MNKKTWLTAGSAALAVVGASDQFVGTNLRGTVGLGSVSPWIFIGLGAVGLFLIHRK